MTTHRSILSRRLLWASLLFTIASVAGCEKEKSTSGSASACASRRQSPVDDTGKRVDSLAESALRESLKPGTIAVFDAYGATLPDIVATVSGLPMPRAAVMAEVMRLQPSGLPDDAAGRRALVDRAIGFLADGLRVRGAVELAGLVTEVNDRLASFMKQKRGAHPTREAYEAALAKRWLSPVSHEWWWYRKVGLRTLARSKGAADVPESEVKARYERNPTAMSDGDGNPMDYAAARPFLRDMVVEERVREEARREFEQLLRNVDTEVLIPSGATATHN